MNAQRLEQIIREIGDENGVVVEQMEICPDGSKGWHIHMKADGNPFSDEDFGDDPGQELLVPLRGRECRYQSSRLGSAGVEGFRAENGLPADWRMEWHSRVEAWDEYTDAPDIHRIAAWIGPETESARPRAAIRREFEQDLVGEIGGDLHMVTRLVSHLSLPVEQHQKDAIKGAISTIMRRTTCL